MVGEGVLHVALQQNDIHQVVVVGRTSCGVLHPKLTEYLVADFTDISSCITALSSIDACFFCAGVSSVGKNESTFRYLTYAITMAFAIALPKKGSSPAPSITRPQRASFTISTLGAKVQLIPAEEASSAAI